MKLNNTMRMCATAPFAVSAALAKYLEDKGLISVLPFDCSNSANVQLKDLAISKMRQFVKEARIERKWNVPANASPIKILEALRLVDDNGSILNPAALLFGKDPQRFFPASCVKCAWFLTDRVEKPMADHQIYTGDIFKMVDDATFFVMSHISNQIGPHDAAGSAAKTLLWSCRARKVRLRVRLRLWIRLWIGLWIRLWIRLWTVPLMNAY